MSKKVKLNIFRPSATVELHSLALKMRTQGKKVFSLAAGEPKMPASTLMPKIKDLGYPPVSGLQDLRKKSASWLNRNYHSNYSTDEVSVVPGAKMGIFLLLRALLKPREQAAIIAPYWVSYPQIVQLCYGKATILKTREKNFWKITVDDINNIDAKKCKVLILNNASNPCAVIYTQNELKAILSASVKKGLFVISDEVYSGLTYDGKFHSCGEFKQFKNNLAVVQSCSKNFAMPGIRTGFVFARADIIKTVNSLNSQTTSGVSLLSQSAALLALENPESITRKINLEMKTRRDLMHRLLEKYWGEKFYKPKCALYFFLKVSALSSKYTNNDTKFCSDLLKKHKAVIVPGTAFGQKGFVRLSFGGEAKTIEKGVKFLAQFCGK